MSTRERLFLPTWIKWTKYGRVPWKIILHVLLLIVVTGQVKYTRTVVPFPAVDALVCLPLSSLPRIRQILLLNIQDSASSRAVTNAFYYFFFPPGYSFDECVPAYSAGGVL